LPHMARTGEPRIKRWRKKKEKGEIEKKKREEGPSRAARSRKKKEKTC